MANHHTSPRRVDTSICVLRWDGEVVSPFMNGRPKSHWPLLPRKMSIYTVSCHLKNIALAPRVP